MVFVSPVFVFLFLPGTLLLYMLACLTRKQALKNGSLLLCSLVFYSWGGLNYTLLLLLSTCANYVFGLLLDEKRQKVCPPKRRKLIFIISVVYNVGILFVFKYFNFFMDSADSIAHVFHTALPVSIPPITLPIGISFFTFQIMSYVFDVYQKKVETQRNIFDLALYIMLFPQLIAGPIVRYIDVNDEIRERHTDLDMIHAGITRFILGFCKKIFLANGMGYMADTVFLDVPMLNTPYAWLGIICYALQIYMDFSSYSDMAIGLGLIFGFHFLENFNYPYISRSIKEFWRRWHISLSSWFRDYVYIPLGGSRAGTGKTYRNLLVVFLLTGFWHGADWTFIIWGLYHGFFLVLERGRFGRMIENMPKAFQRIYTLLVVLIGWVFFRCDTLTEAVIYIKAMFAFDFTYFNMLDILEGLDREFITLFLISLIGSLPVIPKLKEKFGGHQAVALAADMGLIFLFAWSVCYMVGADFNPFIYFRF